MEIASIGGNTTTTAETNPNSSISQDDFIELFLAQLNFQDPLEPVDNREFLAQMAQFTNLQISQTSDESLANLVAMSSSDQALTLLGKTVDITTNGVSVTATVEAIHYSSNGATLSIKTQAGDTLTDVPLGQVRVVQ